MGGTFMGLAAPIYGAYSQYVDNSSTIHTEVSPRGQEKRTVSITSTAASQATWSTQGGSANHIFAAHYAEMTGDISGTGLTNILTGQLVECISNSTSTQIQLYGQMVTLVQGAASSNYGGRVAVQQLAYQGISGYSPEAPAGQSFINFHTRAGHLANLFTCLTGAWTETDHPDEYFVTCVAAAADHALKIMVDNVQYYIMLSDTTAA